MFRARFSDVFPKSLPNYGPQDIERGVTDSPPSDDVERLLCALIGLVLNRKKDVEYVSRRCFPLLISLLQLRVSQVLRFMVWVVC